MAKRARRYKRLAAQRSYDYDSHDENGDFTGLTVDQWKYCVEYDIKALLRNNQNAASVAYIYHDRDLLVVKDDDGNEVNVLDPETNRYKFKPLHVHFVLEFRDSVTDKVGKDALHISRDANCKGVSNFTHAMRYLTHVTEKAIDDGKHQYPESDVKLLGDWGDPDKLPAEYGLTSECPYHWLKNGATSKLSAKRAKEEHDKKIEEIIVKYELLLGMGKITMQDLTHRICTESCEDNLALALEVMNYGEKRLNRAFASAQEHKSTMIKKGQDRDLRTFYVGGAGGTGKSGLASKLAIALDPAHEAPHKLSIQASTTTFDPVGNYGGQGSTIADDLPPAAIKNPQAFFQFTDPHQLADVGSRNFDKPWLSHYFFITNALSWPEWLEKQMLYSQGGTRYAKPNTYKSKYSKKLDKVDKNYDMSVDWTGADSKRDRWQYQRRIGTFIDVESLPKTNHSLATVWLLDRKHHVYVLAGKYECSDVTSEESKDGWAASIIKGMNKTQKLIDSDQAMDLPMRVEFESQTGLKYIKSLDNKLNDPIFLKHMADYTKPDEDDPFMDHEKIKVFDPKTMSVVDYFGSDYHLNSTYLNAFDYARELELNNYKIIHTHSLQVDWSVENMDDFDELSDATFDELAD